MDQAVCGGCNNEFEPKRKWQKYCSDKCRWKAWDKEHPRAGLRKKSKNKKGA